MKLEVILENDNLKKDTTKTNKTLEDLRKERNRSISDSLKIEEDIRLKDNELDNFISNNEFQIERDRLRREKDEISGFKNNLNQMVNRKANMNMVFVKTKLGHFENDFQRLQIPTIKFSVDEKNYEKNKKVLLKIIYNLDLVASDIDSIIKLKVAEYTNRLEQMNTESQKQSKRLQEIKASIIDYDKRIRYNENMKKSLIKNSNEKLSKYEESINFFENRKYEKINEKYIYEITLIVENLSKVAYKSEFLTDQIDELKKLQHELVEALAKDEFDLADKLIAKLKKNISKITELVAESMTIGTIIKELFKDGLFMDYMELGKTKDSENAHLQQYISTFHAHMPTLKEFLEIYPDYKIYIDGHADRTEYLTKGPYKNTQLSFRRVQKAYSLMKEVEIDTSKIFLDYFGKFHNLTPCKELKQFEIDTVINRRIDVRVIADNDTLESSLKYLHFKDSLNIPISQSKSKVFRHENGFWLEYGYDSKIADIDSLYYKEEAYDSLLSRNSVFKKLMEEKRKSPLYNKENEYEHDGCFRLGNQVCLVLSINEKDFKIKICEKGAKTINEIKNDVLKNYLWGVQPIAQN